MSYRLEYAKTNRAGCQFSACKNREVKIDKGGLKLGVWVETQDNAWWQHRHWGCVTPRQLANIRVAIAGSYDMLDGYEDLTEEDQLRVRTAIEIGHVADRDLINADAEMNRLGAAAAKQEAEKQAKKEEREAYKAAQKERKEMKEMKEREKLEKKEMKEKEKLEKKLAKEKKAEETSKSKKAKEEAKTEGEWGTEKMPVKKKSGKIAASNDDSEDDEDVVQKGPNKRARVKKEEEDEVAPPPKRARAKKILPKAEPESDTLAGEDDVQAPEHPKEADPAVKNEETHDTFEPTTKPKKGRAKVKKEEVALEVEAAAEDPMDVDVEPSAPAKPKKGRAAKTKKGEAAPEPAPEPATSSGLRRSSRNKTV